MAELAPALRDPPRSPVKAGPAEHDESETAEGEPDQRGTTRTSSTGEGTPGEGLGGSGRGAKARTLREGRASGSLPASHWHALLIHALRRVAAAG